MAQKKDEKWKKKCWYKKQNLNCNFIMHKQEFGEGHGTVNINYDWLLVWSKKPQKVKKKKIKLLNGDCDFLC